MKARLLTVLALGCGKPSTGPAMGGGATGLEPDNTIETDADADGDADADSDDTAAPAIEGTGYSRGDTAYNLTATDQAGVPFALHDRAGSTVVLVVGNLDVSTTADTLSNLADIASEHSDVSFIAFIGRDATGTQCDLSCAGNVQGTYGFSPVLWEASAAMPTFNAWAVAMNTRTYIIDASMEIAWTKNGTANGSQVDNELDDLD